MAGSSQSERPKGWPTHPEGLGTHVGGGNPEPGGGGLAVLQPRASGPHLVPSARFPGPPRGRPGDRQGELWWSLGRVTTLTVGPEVSWPLPLSLLHFKCLQLPIPTAGVPGRPMQSTSAIPAASSLGNGGTQRARGHGLISRARCPGGPGIQTTPTLVHQLRERARGTGLGQGALQGVKEKNGLVTLGLVAGICGRRQRRGHINYY